MAHDTGDSGFLQREGVRAAIIQIVVVGLLITAILYLANNVAENLARQGIATGFGFLDNPTEWDVGEAILPHDRADPYWWTFVVGVANTLYVAALSLVLITVIGIAVGTSRVSNNWLLSQFASAYVEVFRNVPLILQIIFWYTVTREFPHIRDAVNFGDVLLLSNRGANFPLLTDAPGYFFGVVAFLIGIVATILTGRYSEHHRSKTGKPIAVWPFAILFLLILPLTIWALLGAPTELNNPVPSKFGVKGGGSISPEFIALLLGLSMHYGAQVGEIVRSGIESVPPGQTEAARAIGLKERRIFSKVILPQTLRVAIPPTASQYMSAVRNSSLAVAIGYPELFSIGSTTINQAGQAVEVMVIMLGVYLVISLVIAAVMNFFNHLVAFKT